MIARPLPIPPSPPSSPRIGGRAGRGAVLDRRRAGLRRRYRGLAVVCSWITVLTALVIVYLLLVADGTRVGYELSRANQARVTLQDQTARLDDQIAQLRSRDRLAAVAAHLGMNDPAVYAVAKMPEAPVAASRGRMLAFLSAITNWMK